MREFQPDQVIDERYRLVRPIGSGTFGVVWCAEHLVLHSMVALKLLAASGAMGRHGFREARAAASLRSPHVVQILDCGVADGVPYIAMELLEGESLEQRLVRLRKLDVVQTERLVRHIARAIGRAHEAGVIHRDLKPGNVFIQANDGEEMAKVLDFGIAKTDDCALAPSSPGATPAGMLFGTPSYMSPEQFQGDPALDGRTDIWSLGVIAYECLVGRGPFDGESVNAVVAAVFDDVHPIPSEHGSVPAGFDDWFARACAKSPADRYATPKEAAAEFARLCQVSRASDFPEQDAEGSWPWLNATGAVLSRRRRRVRGAARWRPLGANILRRAKAYFGSKATHRLVWVVALASASITASWVMGMKASNAVGAMAQAEAPVEATRPLQARAAAAPPRSDAAPADGTTSAERVDESPVNAAQPSAFASAAGESAPVPRKALQEGGRKAVTPARRAARAPRRAPVPAAAECEPPWSFDEAGRPRAKPACL